MDHLQRVLHISRERLPLQTPGSVYFGACIFSDCFSEYTPIYDLDTVLDFHRITRGFDWAYATVVARQAALTLSDPWLCHILGLVYALFSFRMNFELTESFG